MEKFDSNAVCCSVDELPLVLTVQDLARVLKIGRSAAYALARSDQLKTIRVGNKIRIARHELLRYIGMNTASA